MCLILIALDAHPRYRLVVAANRDEYRDRPAAPAEFRDDAPGVLAGRDLAAGGTWLGLSRTGRFAALTNFRDPEGFRRDAPTRGRLVADFLAGRVPPDEYLEGLARAAAPHNGYTLLAGTPGRLWVYSNRGDGPRALAPGVHAISNGLPDAPWPKVQRGRDALAAALAQEAPLDGLLALLQDRRRAPDGELPDTGVGLERERWLSSFFIEGGHYGTRCSTALRVARDGRVEFVERSYDAASRPCGSVRHAFELDPGGA